MHVSTTSTLDNQAKLNREADSWLDPEGCLNIRVDAEIVRWIAKSDDVNICEYKWI